MPSNTPGRRKGSQASQRQRSETRRPKTEGRKPVGERRVRAKRPKSNTAVAAGAAKEKEFQMAPWPAASAPSNSVQVRLTEASWKTGRPTDRRQRRKVQ